MAFSKEAINNYFKDVSEAGFTLQPSVTRHLNYSIIFNYLTGNSNSLQGITSGFENQSLQGLTSLLEEIDPPSENDQLILDVITYPDIYPYTQYVLTQWLVHYSFARKTYSSLTAAAAILQNIGFTNDDIFFRFISFLKHAQFDFDFQLSSYSEIKKYLLSILPKQTIYNFHRSGLYWGSSWNATYMSLLEESNSPLSEDYIIQVLEEDNEEGVIAVLDYKNGKYIPVILNWLQKPDSSNTERESKFVTAIRLYEKNNYQHQKIIIDFARNYLDYFQQHYTKDSWEKHVQIKLPQDEKNSYLSLSSIAIHFLLLENKTAVQELVFTWFRNKIIVSFDMLQVFFYHSGNAVLPYLQLGLQSDSSVGGINYYRKIIDLLVKNFQTSDYIDILWNLTSCKSKPLREEVAKLLAEKDKEAEQKAIDLLQSKNAESRQTAALLISFFSSKKALQAVMATLNNEVNDNARDTLLQIALPVLPASADKQFVHDMIQAATRRNKLNKPIETWLIEDNMPALFYTNGQQLTAQEKRFLLYRMSRAKTMRSDAEAKFLIDLLDHQQAAPFARYIIKLYMNKGAKPEHKYLITLAALLGNDELVDKLRSIINSWIEDNRTKMAEYGIGALALQGSNKALRLVEWYSRKFKNKKANIGNAAANALKDAADELGISVHELGDSIVPDFGFEDLFKHIKINGEEYRAFIDNNFKMAFLNDDNKKIKSPPATISKELKEELRNITKEVREVVKAQSLRLEYYLIIQRRWKPEDWQKFYLTNPVMFVYATRFLWGQYDKEGTLLDCFLCLEDTSLINDEDDEIELREDIFIGIVHPVKLAEAVLQKWKQKFFDLSIEPVFPQLNRQITIVAESDKLKKIYYEFDGVQTEAGSVKSTLEKHGWQKGDVGDGGCIDHFRFQNTTNHTEAILEVEGVFAGGFDFDSNPKLGRLFFIDKKKENTKWFINPNNEADERLIALGDISTIFYSEVLTGIQSIKKKTEVI